MILKDKKLWFVLILLPVTLLFSGYAFAGELQPTATVGTPPTVSAVQGETCVKIPIELELSATDPDNDIALYQLTEQPRLGTAHIDGNTLLYAPGQKTGTDKFSYTAVDQNGNAAKSAGITIQVNKNKLKLTYADMDGNPAHYAAIRLAQAGVMTGETIGDCAFFRPSQPVSRSEFITMAAAVAELPISPTSQTDFIDDGGLSGWAKPYISAAASSGLVSGYPTSAGLTEIRGENPITLAEACVVVNNLLTETLDGAALTYAGEHSSEMDWAQSAVASVDRLDVLSPLAQLSGENDAITRQTACELLYRTMCLMQE